MLEDVQPVVEEHDVLCNRGVDVLSSAALRVRCWNKSAGYEYPRRESSYSEPLEWGGFSAGPFSNLQW